MIARRCYMLLFCCITFLIAYPAISAATDLVVGDLTLVAKKRVGRGAFTYTYRTEITNTGIAVKDVTATITSTLPHTKVVDGDLTFGEIPAGATVSSSDTFTIRQNRRFRFNPAALVFNISSTPHDVVPPNLTITSPANGGQFTSGPITVSGTIDDPTATVTVNGISASIDVGAGTFTATGVSLSAGQNTIKATATDPAGNTSVSSIHVSLVEFVVDSSVDSDTDEVYTTGRLVRIDVQPPPGGATIAGGTIRITSASQGYDSGVQDLLFGSIFYQWDTSGLTPADDYVATVSLTDNDGTITTNDALTVTLAPNPPAIKRLVSKTDISVPAQGFPVNIVRSYRLDSTFDGPIGYGWTHSYLTHIIETPTNIIKNLKIIPVDGTVKVFNHNGTGSYFRPKGDGTYTSPKGDFRTLTKLNDGTYQLRQKTGTLFNFDISGKLTNIVDRNGNTQTLTYNANNRLATIIDASGKAIIFSYDINNRITTITGPAGQTVSYGYDDTGNLTTVTDIGGNVTTYAYDANHNLTTITDPTGRQTFFTTDTEDRLASVSNAGGVNSRTYQYGVSLPNQMTVTDALGNQTTYTYDNNSSITAVTDPKGNTTSMSYDADLNLSSITDVNGNQTTFTYDVRGNLTTATDPQGNRVIFAYELLFNRITSQIDANGNTTTYHYDGNGNLVSRNLPNGTTETFTYDAVGNMTSLTDGSGNTTTFTHDANGQLTAITYPDGATETYSYDTLGNLAGKTDRMGQTINYTYDLLGRLTEKTFPDSSSDSFAYDAAGKLLSATDENGTINFTYDGIGRLAQTRYPGGEVVAYAYDSAGNQTQLTYPDGTVLDYSHDSLNRLTQISKAGQPVADYTYDSLSRIVRRDLLNGIFSTYSYDSSGRLQKLINKKSTSETISSFSYTYDSVGNRLTMTTLEGLTQYTYDQINQLVDVIYPNSSNTTYNLDAAGNRISEVVDGAPTNYSVNNLNQYTMVGANTYTYDANGNMTRKTTPSGMTSYTYDFENRLIQVDTPTETITYTYDPFGRRTSKTTLAGTTNYIHDGFQVIMEKDGAGVVQATYIYGQWIDEVLVMQRGGVDYFYSQDGLWSVVNLTDISENIVNSFAYDAYGMPSSTSSVGNPYLYSGREYEPETELFYYRARYYYPAVGRFLNGDPIGYFGGINLYTYVTNNPVNFTDPSGLVKYRLWPNKYPGIYRQFPVGPTGGTPGRLIRGTGRFLWRGIGFFGRALTAKKNIYDAAQTGWRTGRWFMSQPWAPGGESLDDWWTRYLSGGPVIPPAEPGGSDSDGSQCISNPELCMCYLGDAMCYGDPGDGTGGGDPGDGGPGGDCGQNTCAGDPTFIQDTQQGPHLVKKPIIETNERNHGVSADGLTAKIEVPIENALVRAHVPIFGLAHGNNFKSYRVEFGEGAEPVEWFILATSTTPQTKEVTAADLDDSLDITIHGNLATWDTGLKNYVYLPSHPKNHPIDLKGTYTVRLVVEGIDGNQVEDRVTVNIANVIPNAWGGKVTSKDGRFVLTVPEQSVMDSFRLISAQPVDEAEMLISEGRQLIGEIYEVREANERFTKKATLEITYADAELGGSPPDKLAIFGFNEKTQQWEYLNSFKRRNTNALYTRLRRLHSHYAIMASDNLTEQARSEPEAFEEDPLRYVAMNNEHGHYLVKNDFENGLGQWSNRDHEVGAKVSLDTSATGDGSNALKLTNLNRGGNFAVNVFSRPFDARHYPLVQFDYRIPEGVKTNFLVKVAGRWYEIGFTDDKKDLKNKRVNIAHIGDIENVIADDQWHTAQFNLHEMLRTKTGYTVVEEIIMADWDVGGYMKLKFGKNAKGATYYIDNFSISREIIAGSDIDGDRLLIDDFNGKTSTNALGGTTTPFTDGSDGQVQMDFQGEKDGARQGHALKLSYDVSQPGSFSGYISALQDLDLRNYQALTFHIKGAENGTDLLVGLKDRAGYESKVRLRDYLTDHTSAAWQKVSIPLAAFTEVKDWSEIENLSLSFTHAMHKKGIVLVDDIAMEKELDALLVDNFERADGKNAMGREHWTYVSGAAAINGKHTHNSPNGIYRISYGGNIGAINAYASELKSFAGWATSLGAVDCSRCENLSFKIRGAEGGEDLTLYLDDGNFRWGVQLTKYADVTTSWQEVTIPVEAFAEYGVDLTHLAELQFAFEGQKMSGTVYLDDIRFGQPLH